MKPSFVAILLFAAVFPLQAQKVEISVEKLPNFMSKEKEAGLVFGAFAKGQLPADKKDAFIGFWFEKNKNRRNDEFAQREAETRLRTEIHALEGAAANVPDWVDNIGSLGAYDFDQGGFVVTFNPAYGTILGNVLMLDAAGHRGLKLIVPVPEAAAIEARRRRDWYKTKPRLTYRIKGPISVNPDQGLMSMGALLIPIGPTKVQIILGDGTVLGETEINSE